MNIFGQSHSIRLYIERDFAIENNANAKVIDYVFNR